MENYVKSQNVSQQAIKILKQQIAQIPTKKRANSACRSRSKSNSVLAKKKDEPFNRDLAPKQSKKVFTSKQH